MREPGRSTSTTRKGWTCRRWRRARAGQSSTGPWTSGKRRRGGSRRWCSVLGSMVLLCCTPPSRPPSLRPRQSLKRWTAWSGRVMVMRGRVGGGHGWLTEAHEDEGSQQHDSSLRSICVDDGRQTTWDTTARRGQALSSSPRAWSGESRKDGGINHLLRCKKPWWTGAAAQRGRCSTAGPAG